MLPYIITFSFLMFWIKLEEKSINRNSFFFPLLILSLFAGIRSYEVGTDSANYVRYFTDETNVYNYIFNEDIEYGYQIFEYVLLNVTHNYFWLFFLSSIVVVAIYLYIIKKYSVDYWLSLLFFLTLGTYTFFWNGLRQGIAIAICTLAIPFLLDKKIINFLSLLILASTFHSTAIFIMPFYYLVNFNIKLIYKIILSFFISSVLSKLIIAYISDNNPRYEGYSKVSEQAGGYLILSFYFIIGIIIYFIIYRYKIKDFLTLKLFTFYATGIAFIIPIALLGSMASGPQRLLYYFSWTLILLLPTVIKKLNNKFIYICSMLFSLIFFILTTSKFSNLTPYLLNPIFKVF